MMKGKDILLVDDEELTRDEFAQIFESTKYKLHFAVNSIEGLEFVKRNHCDLVLLDIIMPDLKNRQNKRAGLELIGKIREIKPHVPIIMVSVLTRANIALEALELGAVDYITKDTMTSDEIIGKIEKALNPIKQPSKLNEVISLIREGENSKVEFKSSLRWSYEAKIIDKEVEMAWLKTIAAFLNTEGGTLLIGVKDDGALLGIEADRFQSQDKYLRHFSSLASRYIGPEFSKFIKPELIPIEGKKVLFVECKKSKKPVILKKSKGEEEFYIRVGPTSSKLPMSQMLEYLENRKD